MRPSNPHISKLSIPILLSLGFLLVVGYSERALADRGFTPASLEGTYAIASVGRGGQAPEASVGVAAFDGGGNFSGRIFTNRPGPIW
jgi:hypothetical protein